MFPSSSFMYALSTGINFIGDHVTDLLRSDKTIGTVLVSIDFTLVEGTTSLYMLTLI